MAFAVQVDVQLIDHITKSLEQIDARFKKTGLAASQMGSGIHAAQTTMDKLRESAKRAAKTAGPKMANAYFLHAEAAKKAAAATKKANEELKRLATQGAKRAAAAMKKLKADVAEVGQSMQGVGAGMKSAGLRMSLGITLPVLAAGVASIKMASDVTESVNAVKVIFGSGADKVLEFGKNSATTLGLTTAAFNQMSAETGALLIDTGIPLEKVADMTNNLALRAADMASIFNTDVALAMSAINQALRGETEAIRKFAGDISEATLQAFLLKKGIAGTVSAMTQQEKRLLRVKVLMDQTTKFAGDFARTSGDLANALRIAQAVFVNIAAEIGKRFIPIAGRMVSMVVKALVWFSKLPKPIQNTIIVIAGLAAAIGPLLFVFGAIVAGIAAVIVALPGLALTAKITLVVAAAMINLGAAIAVVGAFLIAFKDPLMAFARDLWEPLRATVIPMLQFLKVVIRDLKPALTVIAGMFIFVGKVALAWMGRWVQSAINGMDWFIRLLHVAGRVAISIGSGLGKDVSSLQGQLEKLQAVRGGLKNIGDVVSVHSEKLFDSDSSAGIDSILPPVTANVTNVSVTTTVDKDGTVLTTVESGGHSKSIETAATGLTTTLLL